ncbi:Hypothetical predicted protein [Cloeon dipterum]|uniref:C-type lectin domain-containing protein n=1 Tax=Cloeon dipterum TaxID=197152 RepID=A0A8S1D7C1_9INSE|nr:Hypothetical predicted protein [Cloeon dipterum]
MKICLHQGITFVSLNQVLGGFVQINGRSYYESIEKMNFKDALKSCLLRKLELLALETPLERSSKIWRSSTQKFNTIKKLDDAPLIWTSASFGCMNSSVKCKEIRWCTSGTSQNLSYTIVAKPPCVALNRKIGRLVAVKCNVKLPFYCETNCQAAICPSNKLCDDLFPSSTSPVLVVKDANMLGEWRLLGNRTVLFGNELVDWKGNWQKCCSLGMKPLAMRNYLNMFYKYSHLKSPNNYLDDDFPDFSKKDQTKYRLYWSAATRLQCVGQFDNCFHSNSVQLEVKDEGSGSCIAFVALQKYLLIATTMCTSKLFYSCETTKTVQLQNNSAVEQENCSLPDTAKDFECIPKESLFLRNTYGSPLFKPYVYGNWHASCGAFYLDPYQPPKTWMDAHNFCCSLGMSLITPYSEEKNYCLQQELLSGLGNGEYWTSGRDSKYCPGRFKWCSHKLHDFVTWNLPSNNSCVFINYNEDSINIVSFGTADCFEEKKFICEGRYTFYNLADSLARECSRFYEYRSYSLEFVFNMSMPTLSYKSKLYAGNKFRDIEVLDLIKYIYKIIGGAGGDTLSSEIDTSFLDEKIEATINMREMVVDEAYSFVLQGTADDFDLLVRLYNKYLECKNLKGTNFPIVWQEAFLDENGSLHWCCLRGCLPDSDGPFQQLASPASSLSLGPFVVVTFPGTDTAVKLVPISEKIGLKRLACFYDPTKFLADHQRMAEDLEQQRIAQDLMREANYTDSFIKKYLGLD